MSEPRLSVKNIAAGYNGELVLDSVSFEVRAGELLAIMGTSGAGKSTLLRVLCGLMDARQGEIIIDGQRVVYDGKTLVAVEKRGVGLMFQDYALFPHLNVEENVRFGIRHLDDGYERVNALLDAVDLSGFAHRDVRSLSGGQKQRVALIRALAPKPALLLLDEPLANLDADRRRPIAQLLRSMIQAEGTAAIMVTHDRSEALGLSDRVGVLDNGQGAEGAKLVQIGTPEDVFWHPRSLAVARLTGDSVLCECQANGRRGETVFGEVELTSEHFGLVQVLIRPQCLRWAATFAGEFRVLSQYFTGPGYQVEVESSTGLKCTLNNVMTPPPPETELTLEVTKPVVVLG